MIHKLLKYLEKNNIGKCEFAKEVNLSYMTITNILKGKKCSRSTMVKINKYCGSMIIGIEDAKQSKALKTYLKNKEQQEKAH